MNSRVQRWFCSTSNVTSRSDEITKIILNAKPARQPADSKAGKKEQRNRNGSVKTKRHQHSLWNWKTLNERYKDSFAQPSASEANSANHFFNSSDVKYEWSAAHFSSVPGETSAINELPEVAFLGKSNVGKSTLLNNLTTNLKQNSLGTYARTSKRAGFTKTLNSFNIGNKLRIIDTPGYGYNSTIEQGNLTVEYITRRRHLLRCFLLISGEQGEPNEMDLQLIEFLSSIGKPFEIVFTKMDKVSDISRLQRMSSQEFPGMPNIIFTNSSISRNCPKRHGITLLRHLILQSCILSSDTK